jgi:hypothetical protein
MILVLHLISRFLAQDFFENWKKSSLASEEAKGECNKILDQKLHFGAGFEPLLGLSQFR